MGARPPVLYSMLSPQPHAALEYWFFKLNSGPIALLVDWIARRRIGEQWLRVSVHSPHRCEVLFCRWLISISATRRDGKS